jgi:hypothetical protein
MKTDMMGAITSTLRKRDKGLKILVGKLKGRSYKADTGLQGS